MAPAQPLPVMQNSGNQRVLLLLLECTEHPRALHLQQRKV
jgi:hypothetical protein